MRSLSVKLLAAVVPMSLTLGTAGTASASVPDPPARSVMQRQAAAVVAAGAPGVMAEVRDERGRWDLAAGVGDIKDGARPDPRGELRVGSITKTFTATVVMQLVTQKRIALDAPISRYLPGLLPYRAPVTVRELLEHRSGLFDYGNVLWPTPQAAAARRFTGYRPTQLVKIATAHPLQSPPGAKFSYSNTDYIVLGALIERITHHDLGTELRRRILRPAGLRHTYLAGTWPSLPHPAMRGYEALGHGSGPLTDLTAFNMTVAWSSGAMVSTASDLNRFYRQLLTGRLLPRPALAEMQRGKPSFPDIDYGLGLASTKACGQTIYGHVGGVPGYDTYSFSNATGTRQISLAANRELTLSPTADQALMTMVNTEFCGSTG